MAGKKRKTLAAYERRIARLTRALAQVERQIACLQQQSDRVDRLDLLVERPVVLFASIHSKHMH